jgi:hypothetical protein
MALSPRSDHLTYGLCPRPRPRRVALKVLRTVTSQMDIPAPGETLEGMSELRRKLQAELGGLVERRSGLERELEGLSKEIEAKECALELVEVTELQLAVQGRGQPDLEKDGQGASTQVRSGAKRWTCQRDH